MATDGKIGANRHNIPGGNWITIQLNDGLDLTVDLESAIDVSEVSFGFNPSKARYYHRPEDMTVQLSMDGKTWNTAAIVNKADFARFTNVAKAEFKTTKARYVRVISNIMQSEGVENSRIYFDELVVR